MGWWCAESLSVSVRERRATSMPLVHSCVLLQHPLERVSGKSKTSANEKSRTQSGSSTISREMKTRVA